jgi:hypothetical protein
MCKELLVNSVNRVVDKKNNNQKKWSTEEEKRHKGSLTEGPISSAAGGDDTSM